MITMFNAAEDVGGGAPPHCATTAGAEEAGGLAVLTPAPDTTPAGLEGCGDAQEGNAQLGVAAAAAGCIARCWRCWKMRHWWRSLREGLGVGVQAAHDGADVALASLLSQQTQEPSWAELLRTVAASGDAELAAALLWRQRVSAARVPQR
jgi:hypothetical protein